MVYALRRLPAAVRNSRTGLVPEDEEVTLPLRARAILDGYAVADALALHYRDRTRNTFIGLLAAAFLAMLIFELFAHCLAEFFDAGKWPRLLVWLYPILWAGAWALWFHAHRRQYQKKYHDYRALAEGLRVQFFWNLLGLPDPVEDYYLRKQHGELDWIRRAIRWWRTRDEKTVADLPLSTEQLAAQKSLVRRRWVRGQFHYLAEVARPREEQKGRRCKRWGAILFWTSVVLSLGLSGWEFANLLRGASHSEPFAESHQRLHAGESTLVFAIGVLIVGAAVTVAYGEKMAFAQHARQYDGMSRLFQKADSKLTEGSLTDEEADLFRDLGKEALQENGAWLLLHRDRPLELIVP
jgi:hypothetical protein